MGKNLLINALRENAPKGENYFDCNASVISYKTGNPILDYYLGYKVRVFDGDNNIVDEYPSIGITAGCFVTVIGKPSTAKTTMVEAIAANIVRPFENGSVIHFDLEQSANYSRIQAITKLRMKDMEDGKYILRQEMNTISDIKKTIIRLYREKTTNPDKYQYNTGKKDEFGNDIILYVPTVIIIDSIATLSTELNEDSKKDYVKIEEVSSQTDRMRLTGEISRFYTESLPYIRTANITVFAINQIKTNSSIGIIKSPAEILYLDQDETMPGGKAPQFYAHILWKNKAIGSEKYTLEEHGFDGFGIEVKIIKSRVSQAGQNIFVIYDKVRGIDSLRTSLAYAKDVGLLAGNKNKMYFIDDKDMSFSMVHCHDDFKARPELYKKLYSSIIPILETRLSAIDDGELDFDENEYDY
jgi:recA bacterial DNA recombination protein|nr:MAG TPA: Protein recA [Caudoviricetes sp.]